jgi:catechol 2,3-dioxygenase-like lactoylglutathione lyase family enzyme
VLGRFHELSIRTAEIRASVEFYEALGFSQCRTGDTWPHPYGVLTDGRIFLGLHQYKFPSPSITFVRPGIAAAIPQFTALGIELAFAKTGDACFNEIGFLDPSGQMTAVLEARTYFPADRRPEATTLCGSFEAFSLPCADFAVTAAFWEQLGFVALDEQETPWLHRPLVSDGLNLALHRPRWLDSPVLLFTAPDMPARVAELRARGIVGNDDLPRGLDPATHALLAAPEGTLLLLAPENPD